jgi:SAM-dependent methyltransferase
MREMKDMSDPAPDFRAKMILRTLRSVYRKGIDKLRIADLGCCGGWFSLALARCGATVIGIEAREQNVEKARQGAPKNVEFVIDDVKNFTKEKYGEFDVVLAFGILYHLDSPVEWLHQIARATKEVLLLDTHYAPPEDGLPASEPRPFKLSPIHKMSFQNREYEGRLYGDKRGHPVETTPHASFSNENSLWLTRSSIHQALICAGFDWVLEQYDAQVSNSHYYDPANWRMTFVSAKSDALMERTT